MLSAATSALRTARVLQARGVAAKKVIRTQPASLASSTAIRTIVTDYDKTKAYVSSTLQFGLTSPVMARVKGPTNRALDFLTLSCLQMVSTQYTSPSNEPGLC